MNFTWDIRHCGIMIIIGFSWKRASNNTSPIKSLVDGYCTFFFCEFFTHLCFLWLLLNNKLVNKISYSFSKSRITITNVVMVVFIDRWKIAEPCQAPHWISNFALVTPRFFLLLLLTLMKLKVQWK
jgi:hypothetical protein